MAIPALFPDQVSFVQEIRQSLHANKRIIACAATGFGKTYTFIHIALAALERGRTVLVLSESKKIYKQIQAALPRTRNINAGSTNVPILPGGCYLAMSQTLSRRKHMLLLLEAMGPNLLVITDEAHIGTHSKILGRLSRALLIGFTATPNYKDAKHLPRIYTDIVVGPQPFELVQTQRLSPYRHFARTQADLKKLELLSTGDFSPSSQESAFETTKVYAGLFEDLKTVVYKKCLIYTASIKHAEDVSHELKTHGFRCTCVHSQLPDPDKALHVFTHGPINICVSVGILTKGFDFPEINFIILQRATTSLALYLQMIGRGSRLYPGKQSFIVHDYGDNWERFGLWDQERPWDKMWLPQGKKREPLAPIKICPECDAILPASAKQCKECGYIFPIEEKKPIEDSTLVEITGAYQPLIGRMLSTLSATELAIYAKLKNKRAHAIRVAKHWEQKHPGFLRRFGDAMGYKSGWHSWQVRDIVPGEIIEFYDIQLR